MLLLDIVYGVFRMGLVLLLDIVYGQCLGWGEYYCWIQCLG